MTRVGLLVNPAAGHDIRRIAALPSVVSNQEKMMLAARFIRGLDFTGVDEILCFADAAHILAGAVERARPRARVRILKGALNHTADDTRAGVHALADVVDMLVVIGGDGTQRIVATEAPNSLLLPIFGGTNNAFPFFGEGTLMGLVAGWLLKHPEVRANVRRCKRIHVRIPGYEPLMALVDVVFGRERWLGARALLRPESLERAVYAFALPEHVGVASIVGQLLPVSRYAPEGRYIRLGEGFRGMMVVAPGKVAEVSIAELVPVPMQTPMRVMHTGLVALDGEAMVSLPVTMPVEVEVREDGPYIVDILRLLQIWTRENRRAWEAYRK